MESVKGLTYYQVHFLKLGDADSIILAYRVHPLAELILVLIDAGNVSDSDTIKQAIWNNWRRRYVDIAILTHPDKDHKGGFFGLLQSEDFAIKEFWMFFPWIRHVKYISANATPIETPYFAKCLKMYNHPTDDTLNLLRLLADKKVLVKDVYQGVESTLLPLKVVGPTIEFADRNSSVMVSDFKEIEDDETFEEYVEDAQMTDADAKSVIDQEDDDTSATNMSSLIIMFNPGRKFLLTGDATRASLKAMVAEDPAAFKQCVLKVPHHGSKHNLDTELISMLEPQQSAICARGSKKHPNSSVVYWLSKTGNVYLTEKNTFYYTSEEHNNPAEPLREKMQ